ncbi:MAG TPA: 2-oxo-4-hydroxy-4-carboxy-5-ureidoimidazoline decarboxylase [Acidisoma sp.]|nr:2-oxo-4-hydroxy-4-carboxy-5-ureidoimidazoline decarboxylase [Acidisoma sp.]
MSDAAFCGHFAGLFEKTPWIAETVASLRPFVSKLSLLSAMADILAQAEPARKLALLQAHPILGGQAAKRGEITASSRAEQSDLGLDCMAGDEERTFAQLNQAHLERFGFPFIIAVRGQRDRQTILTALRQRFESSLEAERDTALAEVVKIAGFRLEALVAEGCAEGIIPPLTLSLHVLDTATGVPGAGVAFRLTRIDEESRTLIVGAVTDAGGRWALDATPPLRPGLYELVFEAEAYQQVQGRESFYDRIVVRFRMKPAAGHHHIPLILSPFGYTTYRGG